MLDLLRLNDFWKPSPMFTTAVNKQLVEREKNFYTKETKDGKLTVAVPVPGATKETTDISVDNWHVTVSYKGKILDTDVVGESSIKISRYYNMDSVEAKLDNGIIYLTFEKIEVNKNKKIIQIK